MWLIANYIPTSFFSLKSVSATSTGGKSLICPTPFAIKMALLDVAIRTQGLAGGEMMFPSLCQLRIALKPPRRAVVNNTFIKILKPPKNKLERDPDLNMTFFLTNTIAFREQVHFSGEMQLAFQGADVETLVSLLLQINYFGKRGGFVQLRDVPSLVDWSEDDLFEQQFTLLTESTKLMNLAGLLQMLDDCGPEMSFEQVNIYSQGKIKVGTGKQDRQIRHVVLPYRLVTSSKRYSYYKRIDG